MSFHICLSTQAKGPNDLTLKDFCLGTQGQQINRTGKPPSREGKPRREAATQNHGSGDEPDSRVAEGGVLDTPGNIGGLPERTRSTCSRRVGPPSIASDSASSSAESS